MLNVTSKCVYSDMTELIALLEAAKWTPSLSSKLNEYDRNVSVCMCVLNRLRFWRCFHDMTQIFE